MGRIKHVVEAKEVEVQVSDVPSNTLEVTREHVIQRTVCVPVSNSPSDMLAYHTNSIRFLQADIVQDLQRLCRLNAELAFHVAKWTDSHKATFGFSLPKGSDPTSTKNRKAILKRANADLNLNGSAFQKWLSLGRWVEKKGWFKLDSKGQVVQVEANCPSDFWQAIEAGVRPTLLINLPFGKGSTELRAKYRKAITAKVDAVKAIENTMVQDAIVKTGKIVAVNNGKPADPKTKQPAIPPSYTVEYADTSSTGFNKGVKISKRVEYTTNAKGLESYPKGTTVDVELYTDTGFKKGIKVSDENENLSSEHQAFNKLMSMIHVALDIQAGKLKGTTTFTKVQMTELSKVANALKKTL